MTAILYEKRGHTAWLTINRPEFKNTMNAEVFVLLNEAWDEVRNDPEVRVAVLTGKGEEDFCCGGDLGSVIPLWTGAKQPENDIERKLLAEPNLVGKCMLQEQPLYKPIIGAFNGRTLGGGCEILQATDVRIAAEHAIFALPEPKSGVVPGAGSMVRLARQISYANAMKMLLMAEPISAAEARHIGLISEVLPMQQLLVRAEEIADGIAANAPLAMRAIKQTVIDSHTEDWASAFQTEQKHSGTVMMSSDAREGPRAFKEKRKPNFLGS
ncbi:MAG: enoyl-CoA hydratase-related protein [Pseudomonadales bacterium]